MAKLLAVLKQPSVVILLLANFVPIFGVIFLEWDLLMIILLYWTESAVIGLFALLKLVQIVRLASLFLGPFLVFHFGMFMAVHLVFIFALFGGGLTTSFFPLPQFIDMLPALWPAILALLISHGFSFVTNFLKDEKYHAISSAQLMAAPYRRVIVMHITLIATGFITIIFRSAAWGLVLMIVLKTVADIRAHAKEHDF